MKIIETSTIDVSTVSPPEKNLPVVRKGTVATIQVGDQQFTGMIGYSTTWQWSFFTGSPESLALHACLIEMGACRERPVKVHLILL